MWNILNRSHGNVHTIAYVLGVVSVFGYIASFLRDRAFAYHFGASDLLDVYVASFRIPDMLFIAATAFISVYALLPIFEEKKLKGKKELQEFIDTSFYFLLLFLILGSTVLFFTIPTIGKTVFGGFSGESFETFVLFSRIFLIQASLFAISSFFTAILQLKRKFLLYSLLPILYNVGIILGVVILYPIYGTIGLAVGVLLGVALNVGIQIPIMIKNGVVPHIRPVKGAISECWRTVKLSVPRASALLSQSVAQVFIFGSIISISEGVLSVYYFADNLKAIPLVIIGMAYSVATFPILVNHFVEKDMRQFRQTVESAIRRLLFFILPTIAYIFVLREPLIGLFFETGSFTPETTFVTSTILGVFVLSALTTSILIICARAMYACERSLIPFTMLTALSILKIIAVYAAVHLLEGGGYVLATIQKITNLPSHEYGILFAVVAIMVILEIVVALIMLVILTRIIQQKLTTLAKTLLQNIAAAIVLISTISTMKIQIFQGVSYGSAKGILAIIAMTICGTALWYLTLHLLGSEERHLVRKRVTRMIRSIWNT